MKTVKDIKQSISRLNIESSDEIHGRVLDKLLKVLDKSKKQPVIKQPSFWRMIMKNRTIKLATAATILLIAVLTITLLDKSVTPAYAIEQTIEAFRNVYFLHTMRHDEAGQIEDERWIEINADGSQGRYRQNTPPNFLVVDNRENTFIYHKDKNTVLLYGPDGQTYTWISNLHEFFGDMAGDSALTIKENVNYKGQPAHLVRWLKLNMDCYIDPETKLPIALGRDEIYYDDPPEGTFDIPAVPEGVTLVDKRPGTPQKPDPQWMQNEEIAQQKFNEARQALAEGEYIKAVELFTTVVEIQPGRNWAWFWLGKSQYESGQYDAAIAAFTKVIEMFNRHSMAAHYSHLTRGLAYRAIDMENMAQRDFNMALPVMIDSLRNIEGANMFDYADDPLHRGLSNDKRPTPEQSLDIMIDRLREVTGENFGYDAQGSNENNEQAISAWEQWWHDYAAEHSLK